MKKKKESRDLTGSRLLFFDPPSEPETLRGQRGMVII